MKMNKRIVLKLSGEALAGKTKTGLDNEMLTNIATEIKKLVDNNVQVAIVVGGGNFWRGRNGEDMDKTKSDHIGMLATTINGIALANAMERTGLEAVVQSSIDIPIAKVFIKDDALKALERGAVVILTGGTGNAFFTTDTATILRALELEADTVLLAKNIDAVYSADPNQDKNAIRYTNISYKELIEQKLKVIDTTAVALAQENKVVCHLFSLRNPGNISKAVFDKEAIGTIISE